MKRFLHRACILALADALSADGLISFRFHCIHNPLLIYAVWQSAGLIDWGEAPVWEA
ncbi:MAG: hypothetical protein JJT96_14615 [Opitutales bacterium]|nr:hypothetical protein [Opitutales bacterium]